jgi:hypothetical protein
MGGVGVDPAAVSIVAEEIKGSLVPTSATTRTTVLARISSRAVPIQVTVQSAGPVFGNDP